MASVSKNSSSVASATEPPRGTMASPNTVMMIEPVREGSRLSWSMMQASGCGGMFYAYRSSQPANNRECLPVRIGIDDRAPAGAIEWRPLPFRLCEAIGDRIDHRGMMAHTAMAALDLD